MWRVGASMLSGLSRMSMPTTSFLFRSMSVASDKITLPSGAIDPNEIRNIGIAAHVDSGKSTVTERILYYSGRIREMGDVKGKGKGAEMDSMELEKERGITIQSAATNTMWNDKMINLIDTPGHVDFGIEVERALRVLDGAVLVVCGASGVQSQTLTVDKQMRRHNIPRITFLNKLDRAGANPDAVIQELRDKVSLNAAAVQVPLGLENDHRGVIDIIEGKAITFNDSDMGATPTVSEDLSAFDSEILEDVEFKREMLLEALADVDDDIAEIVLNDESPSVDEIKAAIRRTTLAETFTPVLMGSAFKNRGVQPLLDAVVDYLPSPLEVTNKALDLRNDEAEVELVTDHKKDLIALAFKIEESAHGTLTYLRIYQGMLKKGDTVFNVAKEDKIKVSRLAKLHAASLEDITVAGAGDIAATFGVSCSSGDTFSSSRDSWYSLTSMHVPDPVIALSIHPKSTSDSSKFSKALGRFQREDPTLRVSYDEVTKETVVEGMGELHLEVYTERLKREYGVECVTGKPRVAFTEGLTQHTPFAYTHKKQTGGSGQFGRVVGYIEPLTEEEMAEGKTFEFEDATAGNNIPPQFLPAIERGFQDAVEKGPLTGHAILGVRVVLEDGLAHAVDSSEMAFRTAARLAFQDAFVKADPIVREPVMKVDVDAPQEFQGSIVGQLNQRQGLIQNSETANQYVAVQATVPLNQMFGYATDLRSATQGKGEFTMEYLEHVPVDRGTQKELEAAYQKERSGGSSD